MHTAAGVVIPVCHILCLTTNWLSLNISNMSTELDRRLRYKIKMYRQARCINCGAKRKDSLFKRLCAACGNDARTTRRKRLGTKPWKEGSPGRPPLRVMARLKMRQEELGGV